MSLLSRFFQKPDPTLPTTPPAASDGPAADVESAAALTAIAQLPDGGGLRDLAGLGDLEAVTPAAHVQRAARARLAHLIDTGSLDISSLLEEGKPRAATLATLALCKDGTLLDHALAALDQSVDMVALAIDGPSSRVRQLAAERIDDPEQLRRVLKAVRHKDKNVYKIIRQKCDVIDADTRQLAETAAAVSDACAALERHGMRVYEPAYASTYGVLRADWFALPAPLPEDLVERTRIAMGRCQDTLDAHARQIEERDARASAEEAARKAAEEALAQRRKEADAAAASRALLELESLAAAEAARQTEQQARTDRRAAEALGARQLAGLIRTAIGALDAGDTKKAAGIRRAIEGRQQTTSESPPGVARQLQVLDSRLSELKQWKDFAVAPKRLELIEDMQRLVGSTEEPKLLAERIKDLQSQWRTISQGLAGGADEEWKRFHEAAQAAYQPCRAYFDVQAKLRQDNLARRGEILRRLTAFTAALPDPLDDWRLVTRVLHEAPDEWHRCVPVDRASLKPLQQAFSESMRHLQVRLDAWYERNVADKQDLINRARLLSEGEAGREAVDAIKALQQTWKETAPAPREREQALWREFRELCDAVFHRRQQVHETYVAGLQTSLAAAAALCDEVERDASLTRTELLEAVAKIPERRGAFEACGELPRGEARELRERFERAIERCRGGVKLQRQRDAASAVSRLLEAARHIRAWQWAHANAASPSDLEALSEAVQTCLSADHVWPKGGLQTLKQTWQQPVAFEAAAVSMREKLLRLLCIRAELQKGLPTPGEDEVLRREHQVQKLMQGMGQGQRATAEDADAMLLEWIKIGPVRPDLHQSLEQRFLRLIPTDRATL